MNNLSQKCSELRSHAFSVQRQSKSLSRLLSNAKACYDVESVVKVHPIANTAMF